MKLLFMPGSGARRNHGFSLLDLMIVVGTIAMGALVMPEYIWGRARGCGHRARCTSNLKQVALGFKMFSGDNDERFPYQLSDTSRFTNRAAVWSHFQIMSNELGSPRILLCPQDAARSGTYVTGFSTNQPDGSIGLETVGNLGTSYFVGLDASETNSMSLLTGDRNVLVPGKAPKDSVLQVDKRDALRWTRQMHTNSGNLAFGDGSVQLVSGPYPYKGNSEVPVQRLLLPLVP